MNDPVLTKYLNERVRPRAEAIRNLRVLLEDDVEAYKIIQETIESNTKEVIEDGRANDGVSQLTCEEVANFQTLLEDIRQNLQVVEKYAVVAKACVRPLKIQGD